MKRRSVVALNFSPPIDPVAEHRVFTGVLAAAVVGAAPATATCDGIGSPTFQSSASASAVRVCAGESCFGHVVAVFHVFLVAAARGDRIVRVRVDRILGHALAVFVGDAQLELRDLESLRGRLPEPRDGLRVVQRQARALGVHEPQVVLRGGIALVAAFRNQATASVSFFGTPSPST